MYFLSNDELGQLVKQLPSIAEMCDAIHPLPRDLIGVNHLRKQQLAAGKKTKLFFNHYMTEAADSHSLTNYVSENNAASSHSLCAARSFQSELSWFCCLAPATGGSGLERREQL